MTAGFEPATPVSNVVTDIIRPTRNPSYEVALWTDRPVKCVTQYTLVPCRATSTGDYWVDGVSGVLSAAGCTYAVGEGGGEVRSGRDSRAC